MTHQHFSDSQQTYWQMAVIQLSGWMSLPVLATSILILQGNSLGGAAMTTVVGNAILWFIRLGIVKMSFAKRQSTLDLAQEYLGKAGSYSIAALSLVSTLVWFLVQTTAASNALTDLVTFRENASINQFVQISVVLGLASTFLCMEGMVLLRRFATVAFPILCVTFAMVLYYVPHEPFDHGHPTSLYGLSLVLATNLGITADMPTFFRHSRSWSDSIKALTATQVISLVLGLAGLYLGSLISGFFEVNQAGFANDTDGMYRWALIIFIFVSAILANVANVYSASVGWEIVAPKALIGRQEYLILGLSLTMLYILLSNVFSPVFLLNWTDAALVNLSLVLIMAYVASKQRLKAWQQGAYFSAWVIATILNAFQLGVRSFADTSLLLVSFASIFAITGIALLFRNKQ